MLGGAANASKGVLALWLEALEAGGSSNPKGSFTTLSGLNAMKSLGGCFVGTGGAATGTAALEDEEEKLAPGGGASLKELKSWRTAGVAAGALLPLDPSKSPKSPNPLLPLFA